MAKALEDLTHNIVKGKRTKRQRPQSPIPFLITAQSSSGEGGGGGYVSSNGGDYYGDCTTEEDEDTTKCLILLSQGTKNDNLMDEDRGGTPSSKFTSKRYLETPTSGNGKVGIYVYECKTCYRTFPSFQALGGHRASHKKPKNMAEEKKRPPPPPPPPLVLSDDIEEFSFKKYNQNNVSSLLSLPLTPKTSKVYECSVCGAEFTSGQALGGHMRRHRVSGATSMSTSTALSLSPSSPIPTAVESEDGKKTRDVLSLELDLNLPAPEHDHLLDTKFPFTSKQLQEQKQQQHKQQPGLVLSVGATLVDCRY
ncbi:hypothetical protein RJ639_033336 [Escallonia herrerae]|uniref:C2H2-type domain-containing protein n=1 Tax=Escallonia herrerae TaxID=1293975 RepID=A0AA88X153_9ASTE|nr:hypothetical protein RJ639_033336 [Escallonia herrerae]